MIAFERLPLQMQNEKVRYYYEKMRKKRGSLFLKRCFDVTVAAVLLVLLSPVFLILSVWIKIDSPGTVFFRQKRVTTYGRVFRIFKFRTMVSDAQKLGSQVTTKADARITRAGKILRKLRLDEIPQLLNILTGDMTFVGTRPEVERYVESYTEEMWATLLLPAGVTSLASIKYKDEERLLESASCADQTYVEKILPEKMKYNLEALEHFSFMNELKIMVQTVAAVLS